MSRTSVVNIGDRFKRLEVVAIAGFRAYGKTACGARLVTVQCKCGVRKNVDAYTLTRGYAKSCGCLRKAASGARLKAAAKARAGGERAPVRLLRFEGKTMAMATWAKELGIGYSALQQRLNRGWSVTKALSTPYRPYRG